MVTKSSPKIQIIHIGSSTKNMALLQSKCKHLAVYQKVAPLQKIRAFYKIVENLYNKVI
jgi:hypothetical protein